VEATGLATYPDVSVVCGRMRTDPQDRKGATIVNPAVIVEVLSPSTEDYDRGEKLAHYKQIPSLQEIVLVAHEEPRIEVWRRTGDGWTLQAVRGDTQVRIDTIACELPLDEVYRNPLS
jgi:Uma2 family endonuclease